MKPINIALSTILLIVASCPLFAAGPDTAVSHGVTKVQESDAHWWDIPYPDRFDPSLLTQEQPVISIQGNGFVTGSGETFLFYGVNIADPDKLSFQHRWNRGLFEEVERWGANTIRLPIHPIAWRNRGKDWYFARLDEAVSWANALNLYLIIDWHSIGNLEAEMFQHPMYVTSKVETAEFWRSIAHRYKDVPTVAVYELFNEPTDNFIGAGSGSLGVLTWEQWRDQLESLIDLIQVYDPAVITLVGGLNWAYDLAPVADQPVRRSGVAYAAHAYPQKARPEENTKQAYFELWQQQWGFVADSYPMIATEIGWVREDGFNSHIPVINNDGSYGPNLVEFMLERGISWTVWNFDPDWAPVMISDWQFTPTEQGRFFKDVMLKARDGSLRVSVVPSPRVAEYEWMSMDRWREMHAEDSVIADAGAVDLLLLGDSITEGWPEGVLQEQFPGRNIANFGIGGDQTQNLLWRLQNGATGGLDPDVVVLMIGVNNFFFSESSSEDIALGVEANIEQVKTSFPSAHIVVLGILPYGEQADTLERQQVIETNGLIADLADDPRVDFYDIGTAFLQADRTLSSEVMADFLHPTEQGYVIFAQQLKPILEPLL